MAEQARRIDLGTMPAAQADAWHTLLNIHATMRSGWAVVGGQMVFAHCQERDINRVRPTTDADAVLDVRARPHALLDFTTQLSQLGFEPAGESWTGHHSHWLRGDTRVDVLIPSGLGARAAGRKGVSGGTALETRGAQQVLNRSTTVHVTAHDREGHVPLPSLVGALVAKAHAHRVMLDHARERHLHDFALLASGLRLHDRVDEVTPTERRVLDAAIGAVRADPTLKRQSWAADGMDALEALLRLKSEN